MSHRIRTLAAVAATLSASLLVAAPAHAEDQRPCVSRTEYRGTQFDQTRRELEARWEVTGMGVPSETAWVTLPNGVSYPIIEYPACGYSRAEAYVGADYGPIYSIRVNPLDREVVGVERWMDYGATLHGRE